VNDECDALRIRRPGEVFDAAFQVGEFFSFTTAARQNPKLIDFVLVFAIGDERDPFPIRTPARMLLAFVAKSERAILRSVPLRQPKVAGPLVLLHVRDLHDVDDEIAIRRNVRLIDLAERREVFRF
jgi:hypothetical protein